MRSWEMIMALPGKAAMAVSKDVMVSTSRSFVGSSAASSGVINHLPMGAQ